MELMQRSTKRKDITCFVMVHGAQRNAKAGEFCVHVAALLYNILNYAELGLAIIPED